MQTIANADSTGTNLKNGWRLVRCGSGSQCFAYKTIMPIAVKTPANPRLKATSRTNPSPTRPTEIANNSSTIAEGHGTNPPLAPRAIKLPKVTSPSGT